MSHVPIPCDISTMNKEIIPFGNRFFERQLEHIREEIKKRNKNKWDCLEDRAISLTEEFGDLKLSEIE